MRTKVKICFIDSTRCIVRVTGFDGELSLGSSLGEAASAEQAEDSARQRLIERIKGYEQSHETKTRETESKNQPEKKEASRLTAQELSKKRNLSERNPQTTHQIQEKEATKANQETNEAPTDPEDWSEELTAIDMQLKRIGWNRDKEQIFLERAYGHGSRHKLTKYSDIVSFLSQLTKFEKGVNADIAPIPHKGVNADIAPIPHKRGNLILEGDTIIQKLGWKKEDAKEFLQKKFDETSRQKLSDEQLIKFNQLIKNQLNQPMQRDKLS